MCTMCALFIPADDGCALSDDRGSVTTFASYSETADAAASTSTAYVMAAGDTFNGTLGSAGDRDWVRITLEAGTYDVTLNGVGLSDPYLRVYDATGRQVDYDDDGGPGLNSALSLEVTTQQTYYLSAGAWADRSAGTYTLSVQAGTPSVPAAEADLDTLAGFLTNGYWGGTARRHDTAGPDNAITVDITALTAAGQQLARWAFETWEMVADITFVEVTGGADITFDDDQSGAYASSSRSGGTILSSNVNVSTSWLNSYGTSIDSYSFQTYVHEIGHALGLGHQGGYNGSADYGQDEEFANDSWQVSVMSYFSQRENTEVDASYARLATAMMADVLAIQNLYGAAGTGSATAGNTVWGETANMGGYLQDVMRALYGGSGSGSTSYNSANMAFTIYDAGGHDLIDFASQTRAMTLDLREESFSDVNGLTGNLAIARGAVIEDARTGAGADMIIGNDAANAITSGAGNDTVLGGAGADDLQGAAGHDHLTGGAEGDRLAGGDGDDILYGDTFQVGLAASTGAEVWRLYQAALGRAPDDAGHLGWTTRLVEGDNTLVDVANAFVGSAEFNARYGTVSSSTDFVTLLYNNVLGRNPDAAGLAGWANRLDNEGWSQGRVVAQFANSAENQLRTAGDTTDFLEARTDAVWSDDVFRAYQATLGRTPDMPGFLGWTERLGDGRELLDAVNGFVTSTEFQTGYADATTTGSFITQIYRNVLDRAVDAVGLAGWTDRLDNQGWTRAEGVLGISQSAEFIRNSTGDLIAWMRGHGTDDTLEGGTGTNVLVGGILSDAFVFDADEDGTSTVTDLEAWDTLVFDDFGYAT
ncbi:MAG: DUF4214 domain-containing protein, partial [Ruegeria sp.]